MKPLTKQQIETVYNWLNEWEQLKDTAIPLRFKERFSEQLNTPVVVKSVCFVCNKKQPTVCQDCFAKEVFRVDE